MKAFTIYYDHESGELTTITDAPQFAAESAMMRADVLRDAVYAVSQRYAAETERLYAEYTRRQRAAARRKMKAARS